MKECEKALEHSFDKAKSSLDANARPNNIDIGDVVHVETSQCGLLHHKFADRYKVPYKVMEIMHNNNVRLTPLTSGKPISAHMNNCKKATVRFPHLKLSQEELNTQTNTPTHTNYWNYNPPTDIFEDNETPSPHDNSTEDDRPDPSAPPAEDSSTSGDEVQPSTSSQPLAIPASVTRSTADPTKLTPYVYDTLALEKRLSKIIEEKRQKRGKKTNANV